MDRHRLRLQLMSDLPQRPKRATAFILVGWRKFLSWLNRLRLQTAHPLFRHRCNIPATHLHRIHLQDHDQRIFVATTLPHSTLRPDLAVAHLLGQLLAAETAVR